jgi:hypothetical protein
MVHHVKDLSPDQRFVIEHLLGRTLSEEESLTIRPARILQEAPTGADRSLAFRRYRENLDLLADRVRDVPEEEIDGALDEALRVVRHRAE